MAAWGLCGPGARKTSKILAPKPSGVENARKSSLRGLLTSTNARKCSLRGVKTSRHRRKCSLQSLCDFENSRLRRTGGQKNDRRASLEATLLEDAQLRAFHARVHTSLDNKSVRGLRGLGIARDPARARDRARDAARAGQKPPKTTYTAANR